MINFHEAQSYCFCFIVCCHAKYAYPAMKVEMLSTGIVGGRIAIADYYKSNAIRK
jgi:hypothetical protein